MPGIRGQLIRTTSLAASKLGTDSQTAGHCWLGQYCLWSHCTISRTLTRTTRCLIRLLAATTRDIADVAHARWATGTCITSLDLCAAALGRTFCGHKSSRELALPDFDTSKSSKKAPKLLAALPRPARDWMRDLLSDCTIQRNQDCSRLAHTFARKAALHHRAGRASSATANRLGHHAPKYQRGSRTCERPCNRNRFEAFGGASAAVVR